MKTSKTVPLRRYENLSREYLDSLASIDTLTAEINSLSESVTNLSKREVASCEINRKLVDVNEERKEKIETLEAEVNLLARLLNASTSAVDFLSRTNDSVLKQIVRSHRVKNSEP